MRARRAKIRPCRDSIRDALIDFFVSDVKIAREDNGLRRKIHEQPVKPILKGFTKFQFVIDAFAAVLAVGKISREVNKLFEDAGNEAAFAIELGIPQARDDFARTLLRKQRDSAVAFLFGLGEKLVRIAAVLYDFFGNLIGASPHFLEGDDVGFGVIQKIDKTLTDAGANSVYVPAQSSNHNSGL